VTVNSTARWPARLEHLAWLLRAEAVAVVVAATDPPSTVFSHRIDNADWHAILGEDAFARAAGGAFAVSVPSGRWGDEAAFAVVAPIETWNGPAVLCALRREMPFDTLDVIAATSAAQLLALMASDGRDLASAQRQAAELDERLDVLGGIGDGLVDARDASAVLARAAAEVARRMDAGASSIMLVEGDELRLRASVGLPTDVHLGSGQRLGEGIAGWVATSGEKIVLRGRVTDERFHGVDPDARESISVPLRIGDDVLGVLSVKRPHEVDGFSGRQTLLDGIAADLSRALRAMNVIANLQREREHASPTSPWLSPPATRTAQHGRPRSHSVITPWRSGIHPGKCLRSTPTQTTPIAGPLPCPRASRSPQPTWLARPASASPATTPRTRPMTPRSRSGPPTHWLCSAGPR
jgi:putative methionine-R-sulfoxide reductase with GAF domain